MPFEHTEITYLILLRLWLRVGATFRSFHEIKTSKKEQNLSSVRLYHPNLNHLLIKDIESYSIWPFLSVSNAYCRKLMANKIGPASETLRRSTSAMLNLLKGYVKSKACYHPTALENAKVTNMDQGCRAYHIDLWTLVEYRELTQAYRPYNGEITPNQPVGDKWAYAFQQPSTIIKQKHTEVRDLEHTRRRAVCSQCNGAGRCVCHSCNGQVGRPCHYCKNRPANSAVHQPCLHCHGSRIIRCNACNNSGVASCPRCQAHGQLLQWYQVLVEWSTIHSTTYQANTALPPKVIRDAPAKQSYWSIDQKWSYGESFDNHFQNVFKKQNTSYPVKLNEISADFNKNHLLKVDDEARIVRIKWDIKKLDIIEIEYEVKGYENKTNPHLGEL